MNAQVYDIVVAKDGTGNYTTIQAAIDAVPTGTTRKTIFVKKGVYNEKILIGTISASVSKVISLIGENRDSVSITWNETGSSSPTLGVNASDFYMENVTVVNTVTSAAALAVYNLADRQTFKNCRFVGFQDTHRLKKGRRYFFYTCQIEGGTDFIYAGGTAYFYQCTIKSLSGGHYITAPEDIIYTASLPSGETLYYGFIFKDCDLINDGAVSNNSVYLGRPWQPTCGSIFMNCRLGNHVSSAGWSEWSGTTNHQTAFFAEYNSLNADGSALADVSQRVSWSYQLSESEVNNYLLLSQVYTAGGFSTATTYNPVPLVIAPAPVDHVTTNGQVISWPAVSDVKGYVVYANGSVIGLTDSTAYADTASYDTIPVYTIRTVGSHGNLSLPDGWIDTVTETSIKDVINTVHTDIESKKYSKEALLVANDNLLFQELTDCTVYNLCGQLMASGKQVTTMSLSQLPEGVYLVNASDRLNGGYFAKIQYIK